MSNEAQLIPENECTKSQNSPRCPTKLSQFQNERTNNTQKSRVHLYLYARTDIDGLLNGRR